jgi:hypothetical protein
MCKPFSDKIKFKQKYQNIDRKRSGHQKEINNSGVNKNLFGFKNFEFHTPV